MKVDWNQLLHRLSPPKKSALSIYLGPEEIEFAFLKRQGTDITLVSTGSKIIPRGRVTAKDIRDLLHSHNITETSVTATISEESVILRCFAMPLVPPADKIQAIRFEARRHIPFKIDEVVSSSYIIGEDHLNNRMEVLLTAAKKEEIRSITSLLADAGLRAEKIEPVSLALARSLSATGQIDNPDLPVIIIHFLSTSRAYLLITENGIPRIKKEISLSPSLGNTEDQLQNEIRLSSTYYKRTSSGKDFAKIILSGTAEKPSWLDALQSLVSIPVELARPLYLLGGPGLPHNQLEIPLGLCFLRLARSDIDLNLLPAELAPPRFSVKNIVLAEISVAVFILALSVLLQIPSLVILNRNIRNQLAFKDSSANKNLSALSLKALQNMEAALQSKKDTLDNLRGARTDWYSKLYRITQIIPEQVWLDNISITDFILPPGRRALTCSGFAYSPNGPNVIEITNNFVSQLKHDQEFMNGFCNISLGSITKTSADGRDIIKFDITAGSE